MFCRVVGNLTFRNYGCFYQLKNIKVAFFIVLKDIKSAVHWLTEIEIAFHWLKDIKSGVHWIKEIKIVFHWLENY